MNKAAKIILLFLLLCGLLSVRAFASQLFYDPLIDFFKANHLSQELPALNVAKLLLNVSFRFWINTIVSLGILWVLFQKKDVVKVSGILYGIAFFLLLITFFIVLKTSERDSYMLLFYVRRFLIHPLFLLLLIPAFYFQRNSK